MACLATGSFEGQAIQTMITQINGGKKNPLRAPEE